MATRKKHHFIPQFYLRKFSINEEGKCIALYNCQTDLFVIGAPIKHQACEKYLYGKDDVIEQELSKLEYWASQMFDIMLKGFVPPPENSNADDVIKKYILYQMFRTTKAGEEGEESINKAMQVLFKFYENKEFENLRIVHEHPTLLSMLNSDKMFPFMNYLSAKVLVNLTFLPFITSDSPVIAYNQLMELNNRQIGSTGIAMKGFQIFFPIHPRVMLCLYDPFVYEYGETNKDLIKLESIDEVQQLNALQYLNCKSHLYFNDFISEDYARSLVATYKKYKEESRLFVTPHTQTDGQNKRHFVFTGTKDPQIHLELSFIKLTKEARNFQFGSQLSIPRHPSFEELEKQMRETELQSEEDDQ